MKIEFQDGSELSGWRALPMMIAYSPLIIGMLAFGMILVVVLTVTRLIIGRDDFWGWQYMGGGRWVHE